MNDYVLNQKLESIEQRLARLEDFLGLGDIHEVSEDPDSGDSWWNRLPRMLPGFGGGNDDTEVVPLNAEQ